MAQSYNNGGNLGFEAELFKAADKLRGNMEPSDYKHVALGLIFLKYISDAFEARHAELLAEDVAAAEDKDEYLADNIFWVPKEARWSHLQANAKQSSIGTLIDDAMRAIEKDNESLKGVLPKDYEHIPLVIQALFNIGDSLIDPADERGAFDFGNISRASRPVYHLLKRLPADQRARVLEAAIKSGCAVAVQAWLLRALDDETTKAKETNETTLLSADEVSRLKVAWLDRVRVLSGEADFIEHPELPRLLAVWRQWGDGSEARTWCDRTTASDDGLLAVLSKFLQHTRSQTVGDWAVRLQPRLNPTWLESYLDTAACAERLTQLTKRGAVPGEATGAVSQFLKEFEMLKAGKNPDGLGAFDD